MGTDAAVPELDKLMRMCDLFGVSLDQLTGREPAPSAPAAVPTAAPVSAPRSHFASQRILGAVLLAVSLLGGVLLYLFAEAAVAILFSLPTLLCGVLCVSLRRHAGYACGWALYLCFDLFVSVLSPISALEYAAPLKVLFFVAMTVATFRSFRNTSVRLTRKRVALLIGGWSAWLLSAGWVVTGLVEATRPILDRNDIAVRPNYGLLMMVSNLLTAPLALLIFFSVRLYRERKRKG